jgi:hypothetical protein
MLAEIVLPRADSPRRYMLIKNWIKITSDAAMLGIETQRVMQLRMMKLFAGGPKPSLRHCAWSPKRPPLWQRLR